jgi:hypothetical protein
VSVVAEHDRPRLIPQIAGGADLQVDPGLSLRWLAQATAGKYLPDAPVHGEIFRLNQRLAKLAAATIVHNRGAYRIRIRLAHGMPPSAVHIAVKRDGVTVRSPKLYVMPRGPISHPLLAQKIPTFLR